MKPITELIYKYLRHDKKFPHVWCPGCGNGIILGALIRAVDGLGYSKDEVVLVSGIGCSGRMPVYVDFHTVHTVHGRALTFATGIKLAREDLKVIVIMGDGDATAIGGNHFIHACRRNIDLCAIIVNNRTYGMTGGQYSPTTPYGDKASTAIYGNIEQSFRIAELAITAGAPFVGRGTVYHAHMLHQLIEKAVKKEGFGVVEIISHCHTHYGRKNLTPSPIEMMEWQKEFSYPIEKFFEISEEERSRKFSLGVLVDRELPFYGEQMLKLREKAKAGTENKAN
jgi:2-oxoglutarate/2-oxoacid ferredoxin oxidoreductase subunit beta